MRNTILLTSLVLTVLLALSPDTATGQTYYYIDGISVSPPSPTTSDAITITLSGNLSSSGAYIVSTSHMLMGNTVHITVIAADPGGLAVLVPHDVVIPIGNLAAGTYMILIDGNAVLDMAPSPQHQFVVSGSGSPCDDLQIASVLWHAFTDTAIVVHVINNGTEDYSYPNFILFDANGDSLAKETVNFFGIAGESWHVLRVMDGAVVPTEPFYGNLQLWTYFIDTLACAWLRFIDLCPPEPCATLIPHIENLGGALAIGSYPWSIYNADFEPVGNGTFTMVDTVQFDSDTICVAPGHYFMQCDPSQPPTGGQPYFGVQVVGWISGPSTPLVWSLPVPLEFDFYESCIDGANGIVEPIMEQGLSAVQMNDGISIHRLDGGALGAIKVFDAQGRLLHQGSSSASSTVIQLSESGVVLIRAGDGTVRVVLLAR